MRNVFGDRWVEYLRSIDLMARPLYMEMGLCWYQYSNESKWTYDLINHIMMNIDAIIALAPRTCVFGSDYYELHFMMKKHSMTYSFESENGLYK